MARIYQTLKFVLSSNAIEAKNVNFDQYLEPGVLLETFPLGFDTQGKVCRHRRALRNMLRCAHCDDTVSPTIDKIVNQVALVMKMLYLSDLRDLQNEVNSLLVLVQEYTANP